MDVKYTHVITRFFPQSQHYTIGPRYEDIVWITPAIDKTVLDDKMLEVAKSMRAEVVRQESVFVRSLATRAVIGTDDLHMLRTYDEKKREAEQLLAGGSPADCHLLIQEAGRTSVPLEVLAYAVLEQYRLCSEELNPTLGDIEAVRRSKIAEIDSCTSVEDVSDVADAVWPDISRLRAI